MGAYVPKSVHLVGSIGLDTVDDVFRTIGELLRPYIRRVPDGEVGGRRLWIDWQYALLRASVYLCPDASGDIRTSNRFPLLTLSEDVTPSEIRFGELGYAREARASYLDFVIARENGTFPKDILFQVCLPTPFTVVSSVIAPAALSVVEAAYEKAMIAEIAALCRHIHHKDLCIQWDICDEMVIWDGQPADGVPAVSKEAIINRMERLCAVVPYDVELGIRLCYGEFGARRFEPKDAAKMVDFANTLARSIRHELAYLHIPIPADRDDEAFHRPLGDLKIRNGTELFLGLVHSKDGVEGTRARIATAHRYAQDFGVATECGMARVRSREMVRNLLKIQAEVCAGN